MTTDANNEAPSSVITAAQGNPDSIQQSSAYPTFQDRANILIERGIPVVPVEPGQKRCTMAGWPSLASTDSSVLSLWSKVNPNYNTAAVAKLDGFCILDCDTPDLVEQIESETGCKMPATFTVRSAGRGCPHVYFRHTDRSRTLGNRHAAGLFDLKANNSYVVGPGSQLENGRTYDVVNASAIVDFPAWLAEWIEATSDKPKPRPNDSRTVSDNFDIDKFLEWYGLDYETNGNWYITDVCPVAGHRHEQSTQTGFFFDGEHFGFHCFSANCPGSNMTVGQVITHLNRGEGTKLRAPYPGEIWPKREDGVSVRPQAGDNPAKDWRSLKTFTHATLRQKVAAAPDPEIVEGLIPEGKPTMLVGESTIGKTPLAVQLAVCVAAGVPFLGMPVKQGKALLIDYENSEPQLALMLDAITGFLGVDLTDQLLAFPAPDTSADVFALIEGFQPAIIIVDSLRGFDPRAETASDHAAAMFARLAKYSAAWVLIHHPRKDQPEAEKVALLDAPRVVDWLQAAAGARALINQSSTRIAVDSVGQGQTGDLLMRWNYKGLGDRGPLRIERALDDNGDAQGYRRLIGSDLLEGNNFNLFINNLPDLCGQEWKLGALAKLLKVTPKVACRFLDDCLNVGVATSHGKHRSKNRTYSFHLADGEKPGL
jgi:hypothetical protein